MDWIILIFLLVYFLLTLAANLKLLFYFEHASDSSLSVPEVVCKVVILAGLQLAWILVVALPLDVYNRNSPFASKNDADGKTQTAGLQMRLYWAIVSWFMSMYLLLAVPFAVFYYEADFDPRITKRVPWRMALIKTCVAVVVTAILIAIVYVLCRSISMKVDQDLCKQWTSQGVSETLKDFCDSVAATAANPSSPPSISSSSAGQTRKNRGQKSEKGRDSVHEGGHPLQEGSTVFSKSSKGYYWGTGGDLKNHKETSGTNNTSPGDTSKVSTWKTHVDVNVYLLAVMSFIGWITFAIFGGIGIASLPLDAFLRFRARPRPISLLTFKETRRLIGEKARKLRFIGEALAREEVLQQELTWRDFRKKRQYRSDVNRYKKCVLDLEEEYKQLVVCMRERGENPFYSYLKLLGGILALLLSIIWVIHIILNCLLPQLLNVSPIDNHIFGFLDSMLKAMADHSVALLALLLYTFLVCYLLVCVVKGCFKFGSNFFFFIGVHPMKKDETHLNSFLFNVVLVLLSCTAIVQFTARCFQGYSQQTVAAWIFDVQFFLLPFFGFIFKYNIFIYILLFTTLLSATVLFIRLCMGDIPS
ncbi:lmbr1 family region protein, partial [Cystoisospora suis]